MTSRDRLTACLEEATTVAVRAGQSSTSSQAAGDASNSVARPPFYGVILETDSADSAGYPHYTLKIACTACGWFRRIPKNP